MSQRKKPFPKMIKNILFLFYYDWNIICHSIPFHWQFPHYKVGRSKTPKQMQPFTLLYQVITCSHFTKITATRTRKQDSWIVFAPSMSVSKVKVYQSVSLLYNCVRLSVHETVRTWINWQMNLWRTNFRA